MKTVKSSGPLLYRVETEKTKGVPKGKIRVHVVKYETYEINDADFDDMKFKIHDANSEEAKEIAALVTK